MKESLSRYLVVRVATGTPHGKELDRLKELSHRKGEPMTYYMRESIALVLDKYAEKTKKRKTKS